MLPLFFNCTVISDSYVNKYLIITFMLRWKKRNCLDIPSTGVSFWTWIQTVNEAVTVLGQLNSNIAGTPIGKSRPCIKENIAVRGMKEYKMTGIDILTILSDVPKYEWNIMPTKDQEQVECPSYGIYEYTKKVFVSKNC